VILTSLHDLPQAVVASDREVLHFIHHHRMFGAGIGYVDAHLLAAVRLTSDAALWTRDKRLAEVANELALAANLDG
jgi:predicted nucleic acid-binding protein